MSKDFKYHFGGNDYKQFSFRERLLKELFILKIKNGYDKETATKEAIADGDFFLSELYKDSFYKETNNF